MGQSAERLKYQKTEVKDRKTEICIQKKIWVEFQILCRKGQKRQGSDQFPQGAGVY